jgi:hypothetical protein
VPKPRNQFLAQPDHLELMVSLVMMVLMEHPVPLVHQDHPDLRVQEAMVLVMAVWVHLAHLAMSVNLVFPV